MNENRQVKKNILLLVTVLFVSLILIDRYYWAQISQWREDQATNLWLGYTSGIVDIPVGLVSSQNIPNPNGMILVGSLLSRLPNLLSISFFLGLVQVFLLLLVGWKASAGSWQYFLLATLPAISSVILRSTSVEFWNQYTITLVNIFFIFWALRYLEHPSLWNLPPIAVLVLLAPSLYLAGVVNAIVMILITLGMIVYKRPASTGIGVVAIVVLSILLVSILVTWIPYFQNVSLSQLAEYNKHSSGPMVIFRTLWESIFGIPIYGAFQWADQSVFTLAFKHADEGILTQPTKILLRLVGRAYLLQAIFAFATVSYLIFHALVYRVPKSDDPSRINLPAFRLVVLSLLFISLSFAISTWMGGPDWLNGERPDQTVQFLPMFLYFIFLLPVLNRIDGKAGEIITGISSFLLIIFTTINLLCGFMIVRDHLQYRGDVLSEADIPLIDKAQAVNFIAKDWKNHSSSNIIPVDYDLGGDKWDWVPKFGVKITKWYPAPMTQGRSFDYELLRRYGLKNEQEGMQIRTFGDGRYLVSYAFEDPPQVESGWITHTIFGRLRVSIVEQQEHE
ncbi:MAG TPA: hypothetical protein VJ785_16745 [Anaerolineales bacterium]|nr:hypothetical protein [Anaerolineales bacterium]